MSNKRIVMKHKLINKFVVPNAYHFAEKGTVARVVTDYGISYYIQMSDNETKADWLPVALLLEKALEKQFSNSQFIEDIMKLYKRNTENTHEKLSQSIQELISE